MAMVNDQRVIMVLLLVGLLTGCTARLPAPLSPGATALPLPASPTDGLTSVFTPVPNITSTIMALSTPQRSLDQASPDGQWQVTRVTYPCVQTSENEHQALDQLQLVQSSTGYTKTIATQLQHCGGLGAFGLAGLFWSPNSHYFYYTDAREGVPDGCGDWAGSLLRFDPISQQTLRLGGGPRSPDGTKIAAWQGTELVIWDLDQGEVARKPAVMPDLTPAPIVWSPDSQALVYLQITTRCPPAGKAYGVHLALSTLEQTLLFTSEMPTFVGLSWEQAEYLSLTDENGKQWRYIFATRQLEQQPS